MSGRPPLPAALRRSEALAVYVNPDELRDLKRRAVACRLSLSSYLLAAGLGLLPRAEQPSTDGTDAVSKGV